MSKNTVSCLSQAIGIGCGASIVLNQGAIIKITIKTPGEVDPDNHIISNESPLGRALLTKRKGDKFTYTVGTRLFEGTILSVIPEAEV